MNSNIRKIMNTLAILFFASYLLAVTGPAHAAEQAAQHRQVVKIYYDSTEQFSWLNKLVAPLEIEDDHIITDVTDDILAQVRQQGYTIETLFRFQGSILSPGTTITEQISEAGLYHSYAELKTELLELETLYPSLAQVHDIGDSWEKTQGIADRDILALKISDNVTVDEDEVESLFLGAHHAREWISVEVPLYLGKYLLENYATNSAVQQYVDNSEIWIVPMVNPDGHQYSIDVERWWRKNRRNNGGGSYGVDLNRNYDSNWGGPGASPDPDSDTYHGTAAFSEPETQAIRDLALAHDFQAVLTYHSYGQLILYPWGYTNDAAPEKNLFASLTQEMSELIQNVHGRNYVAQQSTDLYITSGTTDDWFYGELGAYCFTIELRPVGFPYFELPENELLPTVEENIPAALRFIEWSLEGEPVPDVKANGSDSNIIIQSSDTLEVTASITGGNRTDGDVDWWVLAQTPIGNYRYDILTDTWVPGLDASHQGKLTDLEPRQVLNMSGLPTGNYTLHFGVDMDRNNSIDQLYMFSDSVGVEVQAPIQR